MNAKPALAIVAALFQAGHAQSKLSYQDEMFRERSVTSSEPVGLQLDLSIWTSGISESSRKIDAILKKHGARIENMRVDSSERTLEARFLVPDGKIEPLRAELSAVGTVYLDNLRMQGDSSKARRQIVQLGRELDFKRAQQILHARELDKHPREKEQDLWLNLWNATRRLEVDTFQITKELVETEGDMRRNLVILKVSEPRASDIEEGWFKFVNMPGAEYLWFSPGKGGAQVAESYRGPAFRYLFTRGKSYLTVGVLEADPPVAASDPGRISEILLVSWGTDFYPRHFGQGRRRWFNLYSGAQFGAMLLSSDAEGSRNVWMAAPHAGVEIWKGARGLVDLKAAYYLPISEKWNVPLRGWCASTAANVSF